MNPLARHAAGVAALAVAVAAAGLLFAARAQERFPHATHAGLFPLCIGCHLGVETGEPSAVFPEPASCTACHDGTRAPIVAWQLPGPRPTNLDFEHVRHAAVVARDAAAPLQCGECHSLPGAPAMHAEAPIPERCFSCHAHAAREHFADAACTTCHVPLAESRLPAARSAALPRPESHDDAAFLAGLHGRLAADRVEACATCHVREQCVGCHVAVAAGSPIDAIPAGAGRVAVAAIAARYPVPASHLAPEWEQRHGRAASPQACATCHTRESCAGCHLPPAPAPVAAMPRAADAAAPGAPILRRAPASHASPFFVTSHGPLAAARPQTCATCHVRAEFCTTCHEPAALAAGAAPAPARAGGPMTVDRQPSPYGDPRVVAAVRALLAADTAAPTRAAQPQTRGGFHPANYMLRHSAEAFGRRLDCASCHSTELFCRDCHTSSGRGTTGRRLGPTYHDAEPVWLLRHGQAARQTLESCTSCHTQRDCMQCHAQTGAFRVSPHGPGFDARRAQRTNPQVCRACHLGDPLAGGR
jgi:hypothetical protein